MRFTSCCRLAILAGLVFLAACTVVATSPASPTRTPRPTITPSHTEVSTLESVVTESPAVIDTPTDTPLVAVTEGAPTTTVTATMTATPPATRRAVIIRPTVAPLAIGNILVVRVERDQTRQNGAIAFLQIVYSGGRGPYTVFHDDTLQPANPFGVLTDCNADMVHTIRITSNDGQVATKQYYISPVVCPP